MPFPADGLARRPRTLTLVSLGVTLTSSHMLALDSEAILSALKAHLDSLADVIKWALLLAIAFWWAGLQGQDPIKALDLEIPRRQALFAAVSIYGILNLVVLDKFARIRDLVELLPDSQIPKAISQLSTHAWVANPFANFGDAPLSRLNSAKGVGVLIIVWWVSNSSLYALTNSAMSTLGVLLQGVFLVLGLAAMRTIARTNAQILSRTQNIDQGLYASLRAADHVRTGVTFLCIGIGGVIAFATQHLTQP